MFLRLQYFVFHSYRARELADVIGGDALALSDLDSYHPEDGMILANTTSIGMQPKVDETPISK
ncbi:bifunctional 3-dehydroquinate dehydratase/shikimate dehydrogenase chloroplastic-like, partial [Trifolium medium]|nr:bifunctional 3-dehydroquinate dehydratase/shikimate dehydrogenase chloroplastic-like [Trifolium medium]